MSRLLRRIEASAHRIVLLAVALSVVAGGALAVAEGDRLRFSDERAYLELAENLADRGAFASREYPALAASLADRPQPPQTRAPATAYRPPTYPYLLGGLRAAGAGPLAMRLAGAALLGIAVWLLWLVVRPILGRTIAALTCLVTAVWPPLVFTAVSLYPQVLSLVLLLATTLAVRRAVEGVSVGSRAVWSAGAGLSWGALLLAVPALAAAAAAVGALLVLRSPRAVPAVVAVVVLLSAGVLPAVWAVRNASAIGAAVPTSTNTGINLLLGNSPGATPSSGTAVDLGAYARAVAARGLDEAEANTFYTDTAVDWVRDHPGRALGLYAGKLLYHFAPVNQLRTSGAGSALQAALAVTTFVPVLLLFVLRVVTARRLPLRPGEPALVLLVLANALVQALAFSRVRFRVPLDPLMIAVAMSLAVQFARTAGRRGGRAGRAS